MKRICLLSLLTLLTCAGAAVAGVDIDFGAAAPVGDDGNLFVSISSRYFGREPRQVEDWQRRYYPDPDDLAVALFLSGHCDKGPEYTFNLRRQGVGWFEIANRCRVPVDVFFVPIGYDPGPPYGHAYGHWKKHKHDRAHVMVLDDDDIRHLVAARMIHEYYGVPFETAMKWGATDRDIRVVMAHEYRERHGKGGGRDVGGREKGRDGDDADDHRHGKVKGDDHKGGKDNSGKGNSGKGGR